MPATAAHLDEVALRDGVENVVSTRTAKRKYVRASDSEIFCISSKDARTSVRVTVQTRHLLSLQQLHRGSTQTRNRGCGKTGAGRGRRSRTTSLTMTSTTRRTANAFQLSIRYLRSMPWADDAELVPSASSGPDRSGHRCRTMRLVRINVRSFFANI